MAGSDVSAIGSVVDDKENKRSGIGLRLNGGARLAARAFGPVGTG